jgi:hypothetical protein
VRRTYGSAELAPGILAETVARRQSQARAGQVVRADRAAAGAQLGRPARCELGPFPGRRGIRNPVGRGRPSHGDDLHGHRHGGDPGAAAGAWRPLRVPAPPRNSASTSSRRYRGRPASLRTSGSRPRRAQVATAAEVTRNKDATCLRVIRSSPMWLPVRCHHVHRIPLVGQNEQGPGKVRAWSGQGLDKCRTARCRLRRKYCCKLQPETSVS